MPKLLISFLLSIKDLEVPIAVELPPFEFPFRYNHKLVELEGKIRLSDPRLEGGKIVVPLKVDVKVASLRGFLKVKPLIPVGDSFDLTASLDAKPSSFYGKKCYEAEVYGKNGVKIKLVYLPD